MMLPLMMLLVLLWELQLPELTHAQLMLPVLVGTNMRWW
jgi:hypothetical protein